LYWNLTRIMVLYIKTFVHLWQSLSEFFLEWKIFQTKAIEEIKTYFMFNKFFFQTLCHVWNNVEIYGIVRQATDDTIMWQMRAACWIPKAADTHSDYIILIALPLQSFLHECTSMLHLTYVSCLFNVWVCNFSGSAC
jgi:hypothetical protein